MASLECHLLKGNRLPRDTDMELGPEDCPRSV